MTASFELDDEYCEQCGQSYNVCRCDDGRCPLCGGTGRVTTLDYESYLGANYKLCPECGGDPMAIIGEPPLS